MARLNTMATRWSSEFTVTEHKDLQASAMAVDCTGLYALLAGRRYLAIKNLTDSSDTLHKVSHQSKYEVGTAAWNPSLLNKDMCAITSNQRIEIWSWQSGCELVPSHAFRAHTRAVSGLDWHRFDPNMLASCSLDTFIHMWDVRDPRRPSLSLSAVAGATQVQWNRLSRYLVATAHDGNIKLWDQRKGTAPVQYIAAHLSKIYCLDWSPHQENQLCSSSQDCSVRFFDTTAPRRPENILSASCPVWRARYTPFGEGVLTVVVPQLRRGENSLLLWNLANLTSPVHTFVGHTDVVLEIEWRKLHEDSQDYQLITWSKDQSLRVWKIEPFLQKLCGFDQDDTDQSLDSQENGDTLSNRTTIGAEDGAKRLLEPAATASGSEASEPPGDEAGGAGPEERDDAAREVVSSPTQPKTLQQEFSLVNINIPNVHVESMDAVRRSCTVTASRNGHVVVLLVTFPPSYPYNSAPSFQFGQGTSIDTAAVAKLLKVLKQTAQQRVKKNKSCLEPCLRQLVTTLDQITSSEDSEMKMYLRLHPQSTPFLEPASMYGNFQDAYVPFPRTSGAKFCSVGYLVCFGRLSFVRRMSTRLDSPTPRSLSALGGFPLGGPPVGAGPQYPMLYAPLMQSPTRDPGLPITSYYFQDRKQLPRSRSRGIHGTSRGGQNSSKTSTKKISKAAVTIYDVASLFFIHKELAEKYVFDCRNVASMCQQNSAAAAAAGRRDLVQAWTLAGLAASAPVHALSELETDVPWPYHPFGRTMVESLIHHYAKHSDIQTAAMLCCAFGCHTENTDSYRNRQLSKSVNVSPGGSPYHTIHQVDTSLEGWSHPALRQNRSNSWSDSLDDLKLSAGIVEHRDFNDSDSGKHVRMLDERNTQLYDAYKKAYAEILYCWNLLDARAQVLKYLSTAPEPHRGVEFWSECRLCGKAVLGASCYHCRRLVLQCAVCNVSVRGSSNYCLVCGHGGHTAHMTAWFETESSCPAGCGCDCLAESSAVLRP
ncbi:GATOR2 complex protein WDR59 isoform X2 [Bacillus rossius redtenbacheri]|uniref:GATOR2 complex protein WDR59 isoform X2 n=1 Tax=Bacillus rossius redtenbacheri TaxID=93214 RepID=UPI002FDEDAEB